MGTSDDLVPSWKQPSHPDLLRVSPGIERSSSAISLVSLPAGALFAKITDTTPGLEKSWSTVQVSETGDHIELKSDLVYCNHSCHPSLVFDMAKFEVRVVDDRPLEVGDELTFFYPSSEWEMAGPFHCNCPAKGNKPCGERISGAKHSSAEELKKHWLNKHIVSQLARERPTVLAQLMRAEKPEERD